MPTSQDTCHSITGYKANIIRVLADYSPDVLSSNLLGHASGSSTWMSSDSGVIRLETLGVKCQVHGKRPEGKEKIDCEKVVKQLHLQTTDAVRWSGVAPRATTSGSAQAESERSSSSSSRAGAMARSLLLSLSGDLQ
jgi:hypothetical protein